MGTEMLRCAQHDSEDSGQGSPSPLIGAVLSPNVYFKLDLLAIFRWARRSGCPTRSRNHRSCVPWGSPAGSAARTRYGCCVLQCLHDFARLYELRNQPDQALALYQQALAIREQRLGPEHLRTLDTRKRYAHLLRACGRTEEAAALEAASTRQFTAGDQEPLRL